MCVCVRVCVYFPISLHGQDEIQGQILNGV